MSKVEILCPNGHRVLVNVSNTTKIMKILEETCLKKGFLPSYEYEIKYGKKTLELSASVQEAGLINLAKLELVKRSKPWSESKVLVQLQTSDGERMQREFMPNVSLFHLLECFEEDDGRGGHAKLLFHKVKNMNPVLIYVKEEIIGEYALRETTLKSLGVIGGRVLLRHLYRDVSIETLQEIEEVVNKEKLRFAKLLEKSAEFDEGLNQHHHQQQSSETARSTFIPSNVSAEPKEDSVVAERATRDHIIETYQHHHSDLMENSLVNRSLSSESQGAQHVVVQQMYDFTHFKFPEETKDKNVYRNELRDVNIKEFQSCDREFVMFKFDEPMVVDGDDVAEDIPDQFFELTEADLAALQRDLRKDVQQLSEQPLMTQSMRQAEMEARLSRYKKVVIRVQFPDRHVVQGIFQPRETVHAVYKFVKDILQDKSISFELYTTPPKNVLCDMTQTLLEANLVPMTRLYFSTSQVADLFIKDELIKNISNRLRADEVVGKYVTQSRLAEAADGTEKKKMKCDLTALTCSNDSTTQKTNSSKGAMPKWLQLSKK